MGGGSASSFWPHSSVLRSGMHQVGEGGPGPPPQCRKGLEMTSHLLIVRRETETREGIRHTEELHSSIRAQLGSDHSEQRFPRNSFSLYTAKGFLPSSTMQLFLWTCSPGHL